jgi:hypothetical protein
LKSKRPQTVKPFQRSREFKLVIFHVRQWACSRWAPEQDPKYFGPPNLN